MILTIRFSKSVQLYLLQQIYVYEKTAIENRTHR
jgi:hypothetical protein